MKGRLLRIAKWIWLISVCIGVGWYLRRNAGAVWEPVRALSASRIAGSVLLVVVAKILLVDVVRRSIEATGFRFSFRQIACMTMGSQPAKYLPGGVWHLVGRTGMYTSRGMKLSQGTSAIMLEQISLLTSAFCFGGIVTVAGVSGAIPVPGWLPNRRLLLVLIVIALAATWYTALRLGTRLLADTKALPSQTVAAAIVGQSLVWALLGLSLWILIPGGSTVPIALTAVGAFGLAWAVGYVAIVAPGGIGVREAAIMAVLSPVLPTEQAAAAALVSRAVWSVCELTLGAVALVVLQEPTSSPKDDNPSHR